MKRYLKIIAWATVLFLVLSIIEHQNGISVVNADTDSITPSPTPTPGIPKVEATPTPTAVPEAIPVHTHNFQYVLVQDASETQDAVLLLQCSCGATEGRQIVAPGSAIGLFIQDAIEEITNAPKNATVTIDTEVWTCYNRAVIDALAKRPDVTLVTNYRYNHVDYTVTIPAGYEVNTLLDENGYCGFRHLDQILGGSEVTEN